MVLWNHSLVHQVAYSLPCDFSSPLCLKTSALSANVTVAFQKAYLGVVGMNQLNCHASPGSCTVRGLGETFGENHEPANVLSLLQTFPPS